MAVSHVDFSLLCLGVLAFEALNIIKRVVAHLGVNEVLQHGLHRGLAAALGAVRLPDLPFPSPAFPSRRAHSLQLLGMAVQLSLGYPKG